MARQTKPRVGESSASTGTGDITLAGALTAHSAFSARCSVSDMVHYDIEAVDANGVPTGDWEEGLGTYSAANTLTRTTVTYSSNSDAAVNFAAGTKYVRLIADADQLAKLENLSGTNTGDETGARLATLHHAASVKSALVDADETTGADSAASFGLIRTTWGSVKTFLKTYFDTLYQAVGSYVLQSTTVNGHALSANVTVTASDVSLGNLTNDAQTKAAIVPNTVPTAGQIHVGNAGGTAFAVVSVSGDSSMTSAGVMTNAQAAKLTTPRAINGTNFDGSAPITVTAQHPSSVFASLPAAAGVSGQVYLVTDVGASPGTLLISNGTRWKPVNGKASIRVLGPPIAGLTNVEAVSVQTALPAALLVVGDQIRIFTTASKSGTTDTGNYILRLGTAGTTSDTALLSSGLFNLADRAWGHILSMKIASATSVQRSGPANSNFGSYGAVATTIPAATTISNISNALFITVDMTSTSTTDTLTIQECEIEWITP